ncbi:unnamed protein product [Effrenium voratum]|nr:unnamed protein product [Effrenium voratum]
MRWLATVLTGWAASTDPQVALRSDVERVLHSYWRGREGYKISAKEEKRLNRGVDAGTYGELAPEGARLLAEEWGLCSSTESVFADLGSGVGKLVASWPALLPGYLNFFGGTPPVFSYDRKQVSEAAQAYLEWPVLRSRGVELSVSRHRRALEAWEALLLSEEAYELRRQALGLRGISREPDPLEEVQLLQGDLLDADISDVTHIYLSSLCFSESMMFEVAHKLQKEAVHLRGLASLRPLPRAGGAARLLELPMSWSQRGKGSITYLYDFSPP